MPQEINLNKSKDKSERCADADKVATFKRTSHHSKGGAAIVLRDAPDVLEKSGTNVKRPIEVCTCPNCTANGKAELLSSLRKILLVKTCHNGVGTRYYISTIIASKSPCPKPPTVVVNGQRHHNITLSKLLEFIDDKVSLSQRCKSNVKSAT